MGENALIITLTSFKLKKYKNKWEQGTNRDLNAMSKKKVRNGEILIVVTFFITVNHLKINWNGQREILWLQKGKDVFLEKCLWKI